MTDFAFPTLTREAPREPEFGIRHNVQVSTSDLNGETQTVELPGARWVMAFALTGLSREDSDILAAWIMQIRGQANRARMPVFHRTGPRGTWAGSPVTGTVTVSTSIPCTGFTAGATVKKGDLFNVGANGQLVMAVADGTANGSGNLTITVEPPLRALPSVGVTLVSANPVIPKMIPTSPEQRWGNRPKLLGDFQFDLVEVFS